MIEKRSLSQQIIQRWNTLKNEREPYMTQWQTIAAHVRPATGRFLEPKATNEARDRWNQVYDNTAIVSSNILASGLMSGLTDQTSQWFRLTTGSPELDESVPVKQWLADVTQILYMQYAKTNTYQAFHQTWLELGCYGVSACVVLEDEKTAFHCYPLTVGQYAIACDFRGTPNSLYREFVMTASQIVEQYGEKSTPKAVMEVYKAGHYDKEFTIIHAIEPRFDRDFTKKDNKNMPWRSVVVVVSAGDGDRKDGDVLDESGYNEFPAIVGRWGANFDETYSSECPGMVVIGDVKQLKHEQLQKGNAIDLQVNPPLLLPSSAKETEIDLGPGGINFADAAGTNSQAHKASTAELNIQYLREDIATTQERIKSGFHVDMFLMFTGENRQNMTATEVSERKAEKILMLGPVLSRFNNEVLKPFIERTFSIMNRLGAFPPPPEEIQGKELNVEYSSVLAQSMKELQANTNLRAIQSVLQFAQFDPTVLDNLNVDKAAQVLFDQLGASPELIRSSEEVEQIRQQRAQQQAQQQQAEQMQQGADAIAKLGRVPSGSGTVGGQIAQGMGEAISQGLG